MECSSVYVCTSYLRHGGDLAKPHQDHHPRLQTKPGRLIRNRAGAVVANMHLHICMYVPIRTFGRAAKARELQSLSKLGSGFMQRKRFLQLEQFITVRTYQQPAGVFSLFSCACAPASGCTLVLPLASRLEEGGNRTEPALRSPTFHSSPSRRRGSVCT